MIAEPRWVIELRRSLCWRGEGEGAERAVEVARRVLAAVDAADTPTAFSLRIASAIAAHRGFGGGTQLAFAVAAGVRKLIELPAVSADELAALTGRGRRSAVGAHGFIHGGLIWETGRLPGEPLGRLADRAALPPSWRIVLVSGCRQKTGLSGKSEIDAFGELPPVPASTTERLSRLATAQILPAARSGSLNQFGEALYEYGRRAGECFAPVQGGPYASAAIADCVRAIRDLGVAGAGQSSWGPTVYAVTGDRPQAEWLAKSLRRRAPADYALSIVAPDNQGAELRSTPT
jgi:beta-RFAP synthase